MMQLTEFLLINNKMGILFQWDIVANIALLHFRKNGWSKVKRSLKLGFKAKDSDFVVKNNLINSNKTLDFS